jgi:DNA helicase-2/ATP-dependent DNA helicase PcrA
MFGDALGADMKGNKTDLRACYNIAMVTKLLGKFEFLYNVTVLSADSLPKQLQNLFNHFFRFIIEGGIEEYEDFDEYAPSDCISFMTIHQSKGLEFPVTMVGSLSSVPRKQHDELDVLLQNQFFIKPPFEPIERTKHFDFRRLFYTAYSRAQNMLVLSCNEKEGRGKTPSKYFTELYDELTDWRTLDFDSSIIKLAEVKPANIKHEYSFTSHILLYENCPLQYKFYKALEFVEVRQGAVIGGSLLHQTIEDIHKAVLRGEVQSLTDNNITQWFENNYYLLSKQLRSYLYEAQREALLKQVLRYRDANQNKWDRIKEAEVEVSLVKEDFILSGKIDLIKGEQGTVELIDFKSGDKPDVNSTDPITVRTLTNYRRQLEVYAHLVEERTGHKVSKLHIYYPKETEGLPTISFPFDEQIVDRTINEFESIVKKIEAHDYDMSKTIKSEKQCGDCDMRFHCNPLNYHY